MNIKKWKVKNIIIEGIKLLLLIFILSTAISFFRGPSLASDKLPDINVQLIDGRGFVPEEGKPLVIHFWATWCSVCKMEAPNINFVSKRYDVLTIAVNSGSNQAIKAFLKDHGLAYHVLNDAKGKWARRFKIKAFPTTFIYDDKGKLRFTEVGYTTTIGLLARVWLARILW